MEDTIFENPHHIYKWLDENENTEDPTLKQVWKFLDFRTKSASYQMHNKDELEGLLVFCKYEGKDYMIVGASRLGDVWLSSDLDLDKGFYPSYEHRVYMKSCTDFSYKLRSQE
jgi:hypothetical protein